MGAARTSIALDGKTLRGSFDNFHDRAAAQVLSAMATDTALVLAHVDIADKSNEIPAVQGEDIALDADDGGDMRAPFRVGDAVGGIEHGDAAAFVSAARHVGAARAAERFGVGTVALNLPMQTGLVVLELDDQIDTGLSGSPECFFDSAAHRA